MRCPALLKKEGTGWQQMNVHVCKRMSHENPANKKIRERCKEVANMPGCGTAKEIYDSVTEA